MSPSRKLPTRRGKDLDITFDGRVVPCHEGDTVAAALLVAGIYEFGTTRDGDPRQPFCNMGTCFDCAVTIDGRPLIRACITPVRNGMDVTSTKGY